MNTLFFIASKLVWAVLSPASLILLLVVGGWFCLLVGWQKKGRGLISLAALLLVLIGFLPVGEWVMAPLEGRFPSNPALPPNVAGVIVLGGTIDPLKTELWGQPQLGEAAERITAFLDLAARYPTARHLYTGGSGSLVNQDYKEADVADQVFYQLGFVNHGVVFENQSRNTFENAQFSKELMVPQPGETWILITSAFHMPRAVGVFCAQQWPVLAYPVDHRTRRGDLWRVEFKVLEHLDDLDGAIREWVGLLAYRLTGKTAALLPGPTTCGSEPSSTLLSVPQ
ncbi:MAG: hypothetical protein RLZZ385_2413 [Pseudomonadota bacterium]|jgi:uncharacterized SAM-binding protein YcdF (DUF218 family)